MSDALLIQLKCDFFFTFSNKKKVPINVTCIAFIHFSQNFIVLQILLLFEILPLFTQTKVFSVKI